MSARQRRKGGRPQVPVSPERTSPAEAELDRAAARHGEPELEHTPKVHVPPRGLDEKQDRR